MSLKWQLLLILLLVVVLYSAFDYGVQRVAIYPSFVALQRESAKEDVSRCQEALAREVLALDRSANDWACWDDTYRFIQDRDREYAEANLAPDPLKTLGIDLLCIHDSSGRLVWGRTARLAQDGTPALGSPPWRALPSTDPLLTFSSTSASVTGALVTDRGPLLLASRPITTSKGAGPIRGAVIMGRFVNRTLIERLGSQTQVACAVWPLAGNALPAEEQDASRRVARQGVLLTPPKGGLLRAYGTFPGLDGKPALLLRADVPNAIAARGRLAMGFAQASVVAGACVLLLVLLALLHRTVVKPLTHLTGDVTAVGRSGDLSARVSVGGNDEIGALSREFNAMLEVAETHEQLLTRANRRASAVAATIPSAIVIVDADLRVLDTNRRLLLPWEPETPAEATGDLVDLLPGSLLGMPGLLDRIRQVAQTGGRDAVLGVRCVSATGPDRYVDLRICGFQVPNNGGEEERHALLVIDDVTEQQSLQEQVRRAAKMEAVGTLAGGVAHDFNNILTAMIGNTELGLMQIDGGAPPEAELRQIRKLADRAAGVTAQLLAFSRRQPMESTLVDVNDAVEAVTKMLWRLIGEHIELVVVPGEKLGCVRADRTQIEQVLMNLAVNARDAMPDGGQLIIETSNASFGEATRMPPDIQPGDYAVLTVTDTGCGMDRETQERIFEPFFTTKEPGKGTGLGLATVYGIVKQHEGRVAVYSEPGQGTTFRIYLPRADGAGAPTVEETAEETASSRGETVLVVEDEPMVRDIVVRVLRDQGYRVLAAADGPEGERIAGAHGAEIDLLLTDVVMPGFNGCELYRRLSSQLPQLDVLYMSGYADGVVLRQGLLDPDASRISKPFAPLALAKRVREVLDGKGTRA